MKKGIFGLLFATIIFAVFSMYVYAADTPEKTGTCGDNLTYTLNYESGVLTISGEGDMYDYEYHEASPFYETSIYHIRKVVIEEGVTRIGLNAFRDCLGITEIVLPESLTVINHSAFNGCANLVSVHIPKGIEKIETGAFYLCSSLTSFDVDENNENYAAINGVLFDKQFQKLIQYPANKQESEYSVPDGVTEIVGGAFSRCANITKVIIPNSVTKLGARAFSVCTGLTEVKLSENIQEIGEQVFYMSALNSIDIPDSVQSIGNRAFMNCGSLSDINIGSNVNYIDKNAFIDCNRISNISVSDDNRFFASLDDVLIEKETSKLILYPPMKTDITYTIPDSVSIIGETAFVNCEYLECLNIPNQVTELEYRAVDTCKNLNTVNIGDGVYSVGKETFYGCYGLTDINVGEYNPTFCSEDGVLFNKEKTILIRYPQAKTDQVYNIPYGVEILEDFSFSDCIELENVIISDSVKYIGYSAFEDCEGFTDIVIPKNVICMEMYALDNCDNLNSITFLNPNINIIVLNEASENILIKSYEGSSAERYAEEQGCQFESLSGNPPEKSSEPSGFIRFEDYGTNMVLAQVILDDVDINKDKVMYVVFRDNNNIIKSVQAFNTWYITPIFEIPENMKNDNIVVYVWDYDMKPLTLPQNYVAQ